MSKKEEEEGTGKEEETQETEEETLEAIEEQPEKQPEKKTLFKIIRPVPKPQGDKPKEKEQVSTCLECGSDRMGYDLLNDIYVCLKCGQGYRVK